MHRNKTRLLAAVLLWALLLALCSGAALAADDAAEDLPEGFWDVRVYVDGLLSDRALGSYDGTWLAVEDFCTLLGLEPGSLWNEETGELTVGARDFVLHAVKGEAYFSVNSRYVYEPRSFFRYDGRSWFPLEVISHVFSAELKLSSDGRRVDLKSAELAVMPGGAAWYYDNFGSSEIFWLARIIHSEAGNQPIEGRIGVGNVVLNRVASDRYPDNIRDVVFDKQFAIQFDPAASGTVYAEPDELDVICACLCFEGYNTVGESMFFVNPRIADDSWFKTTKEFVISIGEHDFYKLKT